VARDPSEPDPARSGTVMAAAGAQPAQRTGVPPRTPRRTGLREPQSGHGPGMAQSRRHRSRGHAASAATIRPRSRTVSRVRRVERTVLAADGLERCHQPYVGRAVQALRSDALDLPPVVVVQARAERVPLSFTRSCRRPGHARYAARRGQRRRGAARARLLHRVGLTRGRLRVSPAARARRAGSHVRSGDRAPPSCGRGPPGRASGRSAGQGPRLAVRRRL